MDAGVSLFLAATTWFLLVAVRSIRIVSGNLSRFEINRRVKKGDKIAVAEQAREERLPDLRALRYVVETILIAALVAFFVAGFGLGLGILFAATLLLLLPLGIRFKIVAKLANDLYHSHEERLIDFTVRWHPALKWLKRSGVTQHQTVHSREELLHLARAADHIFSAEQVNTLKHVLEFDDKIVSDVMTPRSVVDSIDVSETAGPVVLDTLHKTGHSRFPVIDKDLDHVVGMLYMRDMITLNRSEKKVKDAMRPEVYYIRQDQALERALHAFLRTHHHLLIVVNEYRETVGLLSLEDVIEALLGRKIVDEFDQHEDLRAVAETNPRGNNLPNNREDV